MQSRIHTKFKFYIFAISIVPVKQLELLFYIYLIYSVKSKGQNVYLVC